MRIRRLRLSMSCFVELRAGPGNPACSCVLDPGCGEGYLDGPSGVLPFGVRVRSGLKGANVDIGSVCGGVLMTDVPPWRLVGPIVSLSLTAFRRDNTSGAVCGQLCLERCSDYEGFEGIFADGSLGGDRAASAAVSGGNFDQPARLRIPDGSSVYSAELGAVLLALRRIYQSRRYFFGIASDSRSALGAVSAGGGGSSLFG